jgi:hypothetical protein
MNKEGIKKVKKGHVQGKSVQGNRGVAPAPVVNFILRMLYPQENTLVLIE